MHEAHCTAQHSASTCPVSMREVGIAKEIVLLQGPSCVVAVLGADIPASIEICKVDDWRPEPVAKEAQATNVDIVLAHSAGVE